MKFSHSIILLTITNVAATTTKFSRSLKVAEDAGAAHTDAFRRLGEKYAQKKPDSKLDLVMDVAEITASYCDNYYEDKLSSSEDDFERKECYYKAHDKAFQTFSDSNPSEKLEPEFPQDMHPFVVDTINEMHAIIDGLHEDNLDDVIDALLDLKEEINNTDSDNLNEAHKVAASVGLSVAVESSKLWHSVLTDVDHPLHEMQGYLDFLGNRRKLDQVMGQQEMGVVVAADAQAAMSALVGMFATSTMEQLEDSTALIMDGVISSIPASASAFFGGVFG
eukprot:CAMPEP_0178945558 /NCGR_PEP_ID=MMETSP0789-20121207/3800_1 /TAXON_ID=3005 /ORGANISM="Rhizosolenia setigera, Strain CCMP 1694" /LENGTH=277 /DNA_ID=CAMNT_0020625459 /DNA_START=3 /DNA_END=832 /DNA_ORIENTATION=-